MKTSTIERFIAAIGSRRALLGKGLAVWALAVAPFGDEREAAAGKRTHRRRRHKRRRRRNRGGNGLGGNDCDVCLSGCQYKSIQAAVENAATNGGSGIVVCPGTYKERISYTFSTVSTLLIQGAGPRQTILDAEGGGSAVTVGGLILELEGLTITGGKAAAGGGIVSRGQLTVRDCVITGNESDGSPGGGGIYNDGGHLTVELSTISDNKASAGNGGGIFNAGGTVSLQGITNVTQNSAAAGGGIFNQGDSSVTIDASSSVTDNEPDNCVGTSACGA